jgi:hypothetical protein
MRGLKMLCSVQVIMSAQWKHKSVIDMWICHTYSALTVPYITPATQWITTFIRMQDEAFFLKFGAKMCAVILKSCTKCRTKPCQTGSLWTGPCGDKQRSGSPNHHMWSVLLWDIKQHAVIIHYRHFGTTYWPHLQGSRNLKEHSMIQVNWQSFLFWGVGVHHHLIF